LDGVGLGKGIKKEKDAAAARRNLRGKIERKDRERGTE